MTQQITNVTKKPKQKYSWMSTPVLQQGQPGPWALNGAGGAISWPLAQTEPQQSFQMDLESQISNSGEFDLEKTQEICAKEETEPFR